jgi:hypothetical protein
MVFPLFKKWLRPLLGSSARTTDGQYKKPDGFRSIGGGGGDSHSHRRRGGTNGTRGTNPLTNISYTESEERIVNEIKLQNMKTAAGPTAHSDQKVNAGIVVKTEFDISEDRSSHHGVNATRAHEPW